MYQFTKSISTEKSESSNAFNSCTNRQPSQTVVHAKLEMTTPGDHDELEAETMADAVVNGGKIRREVSNGSSGSGITISSAMENQLLQVQGGGQTMPEGLRNMMENGFGRDFSNVRIHTDSQAEVMNNSLSAKAFTLGNDIYFNKGQFSPNTKEGQHLVAHELTHVAQGSGKVGRDFYLHNGLKLNDIPGDDTIFNRWRSRDPKLVNPEYFLCKDESSYRLCQRLVSKYNKIMKSRNMHLIVCHGKPNFVQYNGIRCDEPWKLLKQFEREGRKINKHDLIVFTSCSVGRGHNSFAQRLSKHLKKNMVIASDVDVTDFDQNNFFRGNYLIFHNGERILQNMQMDFLYSNSTSNSLINNNLSILSDIMKEEDRLTQEDRTASKNQRLLSNFQNSLEKLAEIDIDINSVNYESFKNYEEKNPFL